MPRDLIRRSDLNVINRCVGGLRTVRGPPAALQGIEITTRGPCERSTDRGPVKARAHVKHYESQYLKLTMRRPPSAAFSHSDIRQRQARESTRRGRRCPAPARLPTARPVVARAREACPASRREARSRGPARNASTPRNQRASSTRGPRRQHHQLQSIGLDFVACGRARDGSPIAGRRRCLRGHGLPLAAPRATGSPVKRYTASRVFRRALT